MALAIDIADAVVGELAFRGFTLMPLQPSS